MKRYLKVLCLAFAFLFTISSVVFAAESPSVPAPQDINVPVKYICESKGGSVQWDSKNKAATFKMGNKSIMVKAGDKCIVANGKNKTLAQKVATQSGRTILPLSVINAELGFDITNEQCLEILAIKYLELMKNGFFDEAQSMLSPELSKICDVKLIAGGLKECTYDKNNITITKNVIHQSVAVPCMIQQTPLKYILRFDYQGKIDEIASKIISKEIAYTFPSYDDAKKYEEKEVVFGDDGWKLPATLTMPIGKGPFPVVVLVHGSGPNDRDESAGGLKAFRDLAVGLASKNIAVLRYEKRTSEYAIRSMFTKEFTMKEETVDDSIAAVNFLQDIDGIDSSNIIVLGHSQGGYLMPKIIGDDTKGRIKAGIIMSGCSRPLYELYVEQFEYFLSKGFATKPQVDFYKQQVAIIKADSFNPAMPPQEFALGDSYCYYDMKNYDVLGQAKKIMQPILVLQGKRDYQVLATTDYEGWKKAFEGKKNVAFKLYDKLNHMYTEGEGDSTPLEYQKSGNIPQYVIDDIAKFIDEIK